MRLTRWSALPVAAVALAVAVAGCGSGGSSGAVGSVKPATAVLKGDPIVVGTICSCSGVQATALARVGDVAQAWASSVNDNGGINGHPVKMIVKDDAGNPTTSLQAAKELVEQDHVVAIVGEVSLADESWADYVQGKGVPVVGGLSIGAPFLTNPDFFPSGSSLPILTVGTVQLAKDAGKKKFGVLYCAESPVCAQLDPIAKGVTALVGGLDYQSGKISATAPNYNATCLAFKSGGVDALFLAHNGAVDQRVAGGCVAVGYKPLQITQVTTYSSTFLDDTNYEGTLLTSPNAPFTDTSLPATAKFIDALNKYAPGLVESDEFTPDTQFAWTGGKLFEAAAKAAGGLAPTSTSADVIRGLYALKDETLGGLSSPLNFTKGQPAFPNCYFVLSIKNSKLTSPRGTAPVCVPEAQATALRQVLAAAG